MNFDQECIIVTAEKYKLTPLGLCGTELVSNMSVHSLDFKKGGLARAASGLPEPIGRNKELSVKDMSPSRFNARDGRSTLSVRPIPATGSAKNISGGFSLKLDKSIPSQTGEKARKPRANKDYISAFDDQYKVDLNPDHSPSISEMNQSNLKRGVFMADADAIQRKSIAYVIATIWIILVGTNFLLDIGVLDVKQSVLYQWASEFPFIAMASIPGIYFANVALKTFKHN